jgi:hypothetical protein
MENNEAKKRAEMVLSRLFQQAYSHNQNQCGMIDKSFTIEDWVQLVFGEAKLFCIENNIPTLTMWEELDRVFDIAQYGIYVNKGDITLKDEQNVIVIGATTATIEHNELRRNVVVAMRGATCHIVANRNAVVFAKKDKFSTITTEQNDNSVIS